MHTKTPIIYCLKAKKTKFDILSLSGNLSTSPLLKGNQLFAYCSSVTNGGISTNLADFIYMHWIVLKYFPWTYKVQLYSSEVTNMKKSELI